MTCEMFLAWFLGFSKGPKYLLLYHILLYIFVLLYYYTICTIIHITQHVPYDHIL